MRTRTFVAGITLLLTMIILTGCVNNFSEQVAYGAVAVEHAMPETEITFPQALNDDAFLPAYIEANQANDAFDSADISYTTMLITDNQVLSTTHDYHTSDDIYFPSELEIMLNSYGVVNGMQRAWGLDVSGERVEGWVCVVELVGEQAETPEEALAISQRRAERFEATGQYSIDINLYSDAYRTEIIGWFTIIDFPEGQARAHEFGTLAIVESIPGESPAAAMVEEMIRTHPYLFTNGMRRVTGVDADGNSVDGWICAVYFFEISFKSDEVLLASDRAEIFETIGGRGERRYFMDLYNDPYRTAVIGTFIRGWTLLS